MMLTEQFYGLVHDGWRGVFRQRRTLRRAAGHSMGLLGCLGRRTISRTICALDRHQRDWSADYKLFSRSPWDADALFGPVFDVYLERYPQGPVCMAVDDTKLPKTGKKISTAFWQRDPMSPPFHTNFMYGLRFLQLSLLFPHYRQGDFPARAIPVRFNEAPALKRPGKRATQAQRDEYRRLAKQHNLSRQALKVMRQVRRTVDDKGAAERPMLAIGDGSFCNKTIFKAHLDRIDVLARCRKDARLCFPAPPGQRRKYGKDTFNPQQVRQDPTRRWRETKVYFGGKWRRIKYKELRGVLWQRGAGRKLLRLIVVAPQPYKLSTHSKINYRQPSYLLSTDQDSAVAPVIQAYFDRWQIEVNHRDEKDILGVGQAQVSSPNSVSRHPAFAVATYSMLLLAALLAFGPGRTDHYIELPKWRKHASRPSALDLLSLMRKEISETSISQHLHQNFPQNILHYAYT